MDGPRDIQDRIMKRTLRCPRVVRDLLALLPAEWAAAADASRLAMEQPDRRRRR